MSPAQALVNVEDRGFAYAKAFGDRMLWKLSFEFQDRDHVSFFQFRRPVLFASQLRSIGRNPIPSCLAIFADLVRCILGIRPLPNMRLIAAWWVIASVASAWLWPAPMFQEERDPVSLLKLSVYLDCTISTSKAAACPRPALIRASDVDFAPKACDSSLIHGVSSCGSGPERVVALRGLSTYQRAA